MKRMMIRGPHSHTARHKIMRAFAEAGIEHKPIRFELGMRGTGAIIPDTPEALDLARKFGATKSSIQWKHFAEEDTDNEQETCI